LRVLSPEIGTNLRGKIVVHDVFEIDFVKIISPRVEHGKALMLYSLIAVLLDVCLNELKVGLVSVHRIAEVVFVDGLF